MEISKDFSIRKYNTMGLDVKCAYFTQVETKEDMIGLLTDATYASVGKYWLGGGSNSLFLGDFPGMVVKLSNKGCDILEETQDSVLLRVQAGEIWEDFVAYTVERHWWGLENLSGIPGSVGGAVVQNMGAYGTEVCQHVRKVEVLDTRTLQFEEIDVDDCSYSYRSSRFKGQDRYLVWSVVLSLSLKPEPVLEYVALRDALVAKGGFTQEDVVETVLSMRNAKLPDWHRIGSAGSFFTNPVLSKAKADELRGMYPQVPLHEVDGGFKVSAAWLIDQCGWKGFREGDLGVYGKQPLVLVNFGSARGEEIWKLALRIQDSVKHKFGVEIQPEVCVVDPARRKARHRYEEVLDIMFHSLPMFQRIGAAAYKPNLDNTERMMDALGHPYRRFKTIHVAGTNGKGSCSHMLASIFQAAGYKTGLYTSPHMRDFRERIRVNGKMISREAVVDFYEENESMFKQVKASFFEMTVAMAFSYFARERVDIAIIEVGMGGRLDSTNVICPELSLITNISMDHMQFLGDTLEKIAQEKAGIIKKGVPVVVSETQTQPQVVFERIAREKGSPLVFADSVFSLSGLKHESCLIRFDALKHGRIWMEALECDLCGDTYEGKNIVGVLAAVDYLRSAFEIPDRAVREGLRDVCGRTGFLGRWQCLSRNPLTYADTGHNEAGVRLVLEQISRMRYNQLHIVWGMVKDKDIEHILELLPKSARYYFCSARQERALPADELLQRALSHGLHGESFPSVERALAEARKKAGENDLVYVGGSTFVVAEVC